MRAAAAVITLLGLAACGGGAAEVKPAQIAKPADPQAAKTYLEALKLMAASDDGSRERAIAGFEHALALDPQLWEAHYNLGVAYRRRGQLRKALPHFKAAHAAAPATGEALIALAETEHALGDRDQAADLLSEYIHDHPEANEVRTALTAVLREQGHFDDALARAREALVRDPANIAALLEVGRIYKAKGDLDVAELVFQKVLALDPKSATAHNDLGLLALARGDTQRAFDEFEKATGSDAHFTPARMNKASVLLRAGDYADARAEYAKVLEAAPDTVDARVGLGVCLRGMGKREDAEQEYKKALAAAPNHAAALFNLAVLQADFLNKKSDALALFEKYLDVCASDDPNKPSAETYVREIKAAADAKSGETARAEEDSP
jgi:tetratricopeptide (TPR) repeat protein